MRVSFASGIDGFCHRYAALHWAEQLAAEGIAATVRAHTDPALAADLDDHDVLVLYRVPDGAWIRHLVAQAHARGRPTVFAVDDLIVDPALPDPPPLRRMDAAERALWHDGVARYRRTMLACDAFLATSEPLAEAGRAAGKPTFVHRCGLGVRELALGAAAARRPRRADGAIRLGYFSGTPTHDDDFATIAPVLRALLARDPRVELVAGGPLALDPALAALAPRVTRAPLVPWPELPARIASVDVNLAPLAWHDPFVAAKGAVKYLEAAAVEVPTVASPTEAFAYAIRDGETGLLAADAAAWDAALSRLVADAGVRRRLGAAARADVERRFAPAAQGPALRAIFEAVLARAPAARTASAARGDARTADDVALARAFPGEVTYAARAASALPDLALGAETTTASLVEGTVLAQRFRATQAGLARVDVHTVTYGLALDHVLELRLRRADGSLAACRTLPAALAPDRDWVALELAPEEASAGALYVLELAARGTGARNALSFGATTGALDGAGYVLGGETHAGALALRTFALPEAAAPRRARRA